MKDKRKYLKKLLNMLENSKSTDKITLLKREVKRILSENAGMDNILSKTQKVKYGL